MFRSAIMTDLETFRSESREWLEANCPDEMRNLSFHWEDAHKIYSTDAADVWRQRMAEKGWIAPMWPAEYGGAAYPGMKRSCFLKKCRESKQRQRRAAWA